MKNSIYAPKAVRIWLLSGVVLITCMVFIGGVTRLTDSGLSMTEWNLILGSVPPSTEAQWMEKFDQYKQYPEYKILNQGMQLSEFKSIFFWEYFHRMWGRLMGIVFIVPFVYFLIRKQIKGQLLRRCIVILIGGATVGGLGWFMVLSGLQDRPDVSHYRLALHLFAALSLISYVYYTYLNAIEHRPPHHVIFSKKLGIGLLALFFVQIIWGAFTAGLNAGSIYNTYPLMDGQLIPENAFPFHSFLQNISDHRDGVQLIHRYFGTLIFLVVLVLGIKAIKNHGWRNSFSPVFIALSIQFILGVSTILISKGGVPVWIGSLHQLGAILVLLAGIYFIQSHQRRVST